MIRLWMFLLPMVLYADVRFLTFNDLPPLIQREAAALDTEAFSLNYFSMTPESLTQAEIIWPKPHYQIELLRTSQAKNRSLLWEGRVKGDQNSYVNFVLKGAKLSGVIHAASKSYRLIALSDSFVMEKVLTDRGADDRVAVQVALLPQTQRALISTALSKDDGSVIDLLVLYSNDALAENNATAIESEIVSSIAYTNQALADSCAKFRYRLVGMEAADYNDTNDALNTQPNGISSDLNNLRLGNVSRALTLREQYKADLVQLWIRYGGNYCGLAYVNVDPALGADYAFSVMDSECGGATMAHELGHNLGLSHDRYVNGVAAFDYSHYKGHGFIDHLHNVRSIMAYRDECIALSGSSCPTVPYFSNPSFIRDGVTFGEIGLSDAVGMMNDNRLGVAQFRESNRSVTVDLGGCQAPQRDIGLSSCFIATVAYGSFLDPYVQTLRDFRDRVLLKFAWGKAFVFWYYKEGPKWARYIQKYPMLKSVTRWLLAPFVWIIRDPWMMLLFPLILLWWYQRRRHRKRYV